MSRISLVVGVINDNIIVIIIIIIINIYQDNHPPNHLFALRAGRQRSRLEEKPQVDIVRPGKYILMMIRLMMTTMMRMVVMMTWQDQLPSYSHNFVQFGCTLHPLGRA